MGVIRTIAFCCCALIVGTTPAPAKGWRGLIPMKSTCEDVKRVLGVTTCAPPDETYDVGDEKVKISFTKHACYPAYTKFWNVPVGTVIIIERHPKKPIPVSELGIDITKYEVTTTDVVDLNIYGSDEEGLSFYAFKEWVQLIYYMPTKADYHLLCSPKQKAKTPKKRRPGKM